MAAKSILTIFALFLTVPLHAQTAYRVDPYPVTTTSGTCLSGQKCPLLVIPGSTVAVSVTTYTDSTAGTSCPSQRPVVLAGTTSCRSTVDNQGAFGFWVTSGTFTYTVTLPNGGGTYGPYPVTISNTAASGGASLVGYVSPEPSSQATTVASALGRIYYIEDACGAATSGVTDQASCAATAIANADTDRLPLRCKGSGYFAFKTNISVTLSNTLDWRDCDVRWAGGASTDPAQSMLALKGVGNAGSGTFKGLTIKNVTLGGSANIGTLLRLDNILNPDIDILFAPSSTAQIGLLLRAVQIGKATLKAIAGSIVTGIRAETLSGPVGGTITLTGNINSTDISVPVSSCAWFTGITGVSTLTIGTETIRFKSCSAGTATVASVCGADGNSSCRGYQVTTAAAHGNGDTAQPGLPVITDDIQLIAGEGFSSTTSVWSNGGGRFNILGGHWNGADAVAFRNTNGFLNCYGCYIGEGSATGVYQNYNVTDWGSALPAITKLYGGSTQSKTGGKGVDIQAGQFQAFGSTMAVNSVFGSASGTHLFVGVDVRDAVTMSASDVQCVALPVTSILPCNQLAPRTTSISGISPVPGQLSVQATAAATQTDPVSLMLYGFHAAQVSGGKREPLIWWGANGGGGNECLTGLYVGDQAGGPNSDVNLYGGVGSMYLSLSNGGGHVIWVKDSSTCSTGGGWTGK